MRAGGCEGKAPSGSRLPTQIVYTKTPVEVDPAKDAVNIGKHGVSIARAADLEILAFSRDGRPGYDETRYRAWGFIDGKAYCRAFTHRGKNIRAISLRRAHKKRWIAMSRRATFDDENPEWTEADFKKARPAHELSPGILDAFPRTRGPQKAAKKIPISIRLSPDMVERFKADGPGWQARMDDVLKKAFGLL